MKKLKIKIVIVLTVVSLSSVFFAAVQVRAQSIQQAILTDTTTRLINDGIPVKSFQIVSDSRCNPPFVVEYTLQSSSNNVSPAPEDAIYANIVSREVNLAWMRGLDVGGVRIVRIAVDGGTAANITSVLKRDVDWPITLEKLSKLSHGQISVILNEDSKFIIPPRDVEVIVNREGLNVVTLDFRVNDVLEANQTVTNIISETRAKINSLNNEQNTQIAVYKIHINSTNGEPFFALIDDVQFGHLSFWRIQSITEDLFPRPPSP